jgi:hypothetical protein
MMNSKRAAALAGAGAMVAAMLVSAPPAADAAPWHDNCTKFNHKYPHGVGKKHAHDHTSGTPVTNFKRSNKLYRIAMRNNSDLDRDRDKIACEKA